MLKKTDYPKLQPARTGLAGIIYPDIFQVDHHISLMLNCLEHRGNHFQQNHFFKNVQMGVCGSSFASNEKNTIFAAIDGEIENLQELKDALEKAGHAFEALTQAELVLKAYCAWNLSLFSHLDGRFAIAIMDQESEQLLLARDRIGEKPLYWAHENNYFLFASEIKSILASGLIPQHPSLESMSSYLYFGFIPQDMSPIENINKLLPGHFLRFHFNGAKAIQPYWSYSSYFENMISSSKDAIVKHVNDTLHSSIEQCLPPSAKEPIGCFMFGGLGSACTAKFLQKSSLHGSLNAFNTSFEGQNEEDLKAAKEAADCLNIPFYSKTISPDRLFDNLVKIAWHLDEPLADPHVIIAWNIAELASKKTQFVFSGMGCDELFAGHQKYTLERASLSYRNKWKLKYMPFLSRFLIPFLNIVYKPAAYELLKQSKSNPWHYDYLRQNAVFDEKLLAKASPKLASLFDPEVFLHKFHHLSRIQSLTSSFLYFDIKTRLADLYILQYERLSTAHQLIWKSPFLNRSIVEYLAGLPNAISQTDNTYTLKAILKNTFPPSFLSRAKKSRKDFLSKWIHHPNVMKTFHSLLKGNLIEAGLISEKWLKNLLQFPQKNKNSFQILWSILALEIWYRLFISQPVQQRPPDISLIDFLNKK